MEFSPEEIARGANFLAHDIKKTAAEISFVEHDYGHEFVFTVFDGDRRMSCTITKAEASRLRKALERCKV